MMDIFINLKTPRKDVEELIDKIRANGYKAFVDWKVYLIRTDAPVELIKEFQKYGWGIQSFNR